MTPRPRIPANRNLPTNLSRRSHKGGYGFMYRDPLSGRRNYVPGPEASAIAYAVKRNAAGALAVESPNSVGHWLEQYESEGLHGSEKTQAETNRLIRRYIKAWRLSPIRAITRATFSATWKNLKGPHAVVKHRQFWIDFMDWCVAQGALDDNEARKTLKPHSDKLTRKRLRHTDEGYKATYAAAEDWLQIAMELAVGSLQRRGDLLRMTREDVRDARLYVAQAKSIKDGSPRVRLAIKFGPQGRLGRAVARALSFPVFGSTLIRRLPERRTARTNGVNESYLTHAFAEARDRAGAYADLEPQQRPAFHDLRAYGVWTYERAGYPREYVQALAGHSTARMTKHYADGHEIVWQEVEAGL